MEFIPLSKELSPAWDELAQSSPDAWMYSSSGWLRLICEVPAWAFEDHSFLARRGHVWLGAMPLQLRPDGRLMSLAMGPCGPMVAGWAPQRERRGILEALIGRAQDIGRDLGAVELEVTLPPTSRTSLGAPWGVNPLLELGFRDASIHAWIIDLSLGRDAVWAGASRRMRRQVKDAEKAGLKVVPVTSRHEMDEYFELHRETYLRTGAEPHPKEYFLGIFDRCIRPGQVQGWAARTPDGEAQGFVTIARYGDSAYYFTGCARTEAMDGGVYYLLLWRAIEQALEERLRWFNVGDAYPEAPMGGKLRGLSDFKRRFGGELHRAYAARMPLQDASAAGGSTLREVLRAGKKLVTAAAGERTAQWFGRGIRRVGRTARKLGHVGEGPIPFLKPLWGKEELRAALREPESALSDCRARLESRLRAKLGWRAEDTVILTGSGRTAIELALRALKRRSPERTKVILPSYGCRGTFDPILRAGLTPVFVDVGPDLLVAPEDLERALDSQTLATLLVWLCGCDLDAAPLEERILAAGATPILDQCQNLGGQATRGSQEGKVSVHSFGIGKTLEASAGGALVAGWEQDLFRKEAEALAEEDAASSGERFRRLRDQLLRGKAGGPPFGDILSQFEYVHMNPRDAAVLLTQLDRLDEVVAARAGNLRTLREAAPVLFPQRAEGHSATKCTAVFPNDRALREFRGHACAENIELEDMYTPLHLRHIASAWRAGDLPVSESLWRRTVNLPNRPNLSAADCLRVVSLLQRCQESQRG